MTTLPATGYFTDPARDNDEAKAAQDDITAVLRESLGGSAETELTIAAGAVTPTTAAHQIDTEADAAADDLVSIAQTNHPDGRIIIVRSVDAARVVTVKNAAGGAGQIFLSDGVDLALGSPDIVLALRRAGTSWREMWRFYGSDKAAFRAFLELATAAKTDVIQSFTKPQRKSRAPLGNVAASVALDLSTAQDFKMTTTANITLSDPTNMVAGQSGYITIDNSAGFSLSGVGAAWKRLGGTGLPTLPTGVCALPYEVVSATEAHYAFLERE